MNIECKSAGFGFFILSIIAYKFNSPNIIKYGCFACSVTGILCHQYGYRKLDIVTTSLVIALNIYFAFVNKYLYLNNIVFAMFGSLMYFKKVENHVLLVQVPFFISILSLIISSRVIRPS